MGTPSNMQSTGVRGAIRTAARAGLVLVLLGSASGCLFGGGSSEEQIDPNEATAREATFKTAAEKARDNRFSDRMRRQNDLGEPVRKSR